MSKVTGVIGPRANPGPLASEENCSIAAPWKTTHHCDVLTGTQRYSCGSNGGGEEEGEGGGGEEDRHKRSS